MIISLIAAMGRNRVIGKDNALPWKLPADMKRFREITRGKPIIMGRKTFESIGRPLPDRMNIVITREHDYRVDGCVVVHSIEEAIKAAGDAQEIMVIGGTSIFEQFLLLAQKMYITLIDHDFEGDTFFPEFDTKEWNEVERSQHQPDDKNRYRYTFLTLERK
ncbi:MAG: type 3 dihydrofolate reductase [bacterium]|nr:type 3 dihydrofolate reductase [bacterium]